MNHIKAYNHADVEIEIDEHGLVEDKNKVNIIMFQQTSLRNFNL